LRTWEIYFSLAFLPRATTLFSVWGYPPSFSKNENKLAKGFFYLSYNKNTSESCLNFRALCFQKTQTKSFPQSSSRLFESFFIFWVHKTVSSLGSDGVVSFWVDSKSFQTRCCFRLPWPAVNIFHLTFGFWLVFLRRKFTGLFRKWALWDDWTVRSVHCFARIRLNWDSICYLVGLFRCWTLKEVWLWVREFKPWEITFLFKCSVGGGLQKDFWQF
jgi:hypothetical protein